MVAVDRGGSTAEIARYAGEASRSAPDSIAIETATPVVAVPDARFLTDARYVRDGSDLVLAGPDGRSIVIRDYFAAEPRPTLETPDGTMAVAPELVISFLEPMAPGQYAQLGPFSAGQAIGQVAVMTGRASAVRADGTRIELATGDPVYQGDIVETGDGDSAVRLLFIDQTSFSLGPGARLALDELAFDPQSQDGTLSFSMLKGVFIFTSGIVAKTDHTKMIVNTPVALIGIRGTVVTGRLDEAGGQFTVLDGAIEISTNAGSAFLDSAGATVQVTNINAPPGSVFILTPSEYLLAYGAVSGVAPGAYLRPRDPGERNDRPDDFGAIPPGEGSVGHSIERLIGPDPVGPGAFALLDPFADRTERLEQLIREIGSPGPTESPTGVQTDEGGNGTLPAPAPDVAEEPGDDSPGGPGGPVGPIVFDFSNAASAITFIGSDADEIVIGSRFNDVIDLRGGNDMAIGGPGDDRIEGGDGDDILIGGQIIDGTEETEPVDHTWTTLTPPPDLQEGVALDPEAINGVDGADLTLRYDHPVQIVFRGEGAGFLNTLGYYRIAGDGTIIDIGLVWANASAEGSGGDLNPGDAVGLDLVAGDRFGLFLIADGATLNDFSEWQDGRFEFRDADGNPATIDGGVPILHFVHAGGETEEVLGDIFHTVGANLNADGLEHAVSGLDPDTGQLVIGFEDLAGGGDSDFDDLVIAVDIGPAEVPLAGDNTLVGGAGNDLLIGGGGADTLLGGEGDDRFEIGDLNFVLLDGGPGIDRVIFTGTRRTFDLRAVGDGRMTNIEVLDLSRVSGVDLTLDAATVLGVTGDWNDLTGTANTLVVTGAEDDTIRLGDGWQEIGTRDIEGESYTIYSHEDSGQVAIGTGGQQA